MPKLPLALLALALAACADGRSAEPRADARAEAVHAAYLADLDSLAAAVERLDSAVARGRGEQRAFAEARAAYKRVEFLVELYTPSAAKQLNGPALPRVAEDDPTQTAIPPEGFQVVEEMLFPAPDPAARAEALDEVRVLAAHLRRVREYAAVTRFTDANVWDAVRQEVARVVVLGVSGFDSPVALRSVPEAAQAFRALRAALEPYGADLRRASPEAWARLEGGLARATVYLDAHPDFDGFDRLAFVTEHANPVSAALLDAQRALAIPLPAERRAWRADAATLFDPGAVDPRFFAPADAPPPSREQVELGRVLFFDPVLSGAGERSCASCHRPERAFTDGLARSPSLDARGAAALRNAPTVINAGLQGAAFADLRAAFLEDQVADVVSSPAEMHGDLERAAAALRRSPDYAARFARAFGRDDGGAVTGASVRAAVAAYVRSLVALDSRFDRYVRGDRAALSAAERRGFNLFMGRAKCGTCHFAPLFNGTVPPAYAETESEVLGVPSRPATRGAAVDPDPGRFRVHGIHLHRHAFKTPTVRNAELTAPYMHNGVFRTLEEVVDFYDRGGGAGIGIDLPNQTLPPDPLRLTDRDKADLVAFMRALTDTVGTTARPAALPRLADGSRRAARAAGRGY
ncbi:MAG: cytochrome c peroxidase [Gemmatimonadota bacterium]